MTAIVSRDYGEAVDRLRANLIIQRLAVGLVTTPLAELAHPDGTPRHEFMMAANRKFTETEALNADNPAYTPDSGFRAIGTIPRALLAVRAEMRDVWVSLLGTDNDDAVTEAIERARGDEDLSAVLRDVAAKYAA